jgi:hypothetical protein
MDYAARGVIPSFLAIIPAETIGRVRTWSTSAGKCDDARDRRCAGTVRAMRQRSCAFKSDLGRVGLECNDEANLGISGPAAFKRQGAIPRAGTQDGRGTCSKLGRN